MFVVCVSWTGRHVQAERCRRLHPLARVTLPSVCSSKSVATLYDLSLLFAITVIFWAFSAWCSDTIIFKVGIGIWFKPLCFKLLKIPWLIWHVFFFQCNMQQFCLHNIMGKYQYIMRSRVWEDCAYLFSLLSPMLNTH